MKTIHQFSLVHAIFLLLLVGSTLTIQSQNIAPPGIFDNQNKPTPILISNVFLNNSLNNTFEALDNTTAIVNQTIWDGQTWSNGFPDASTKVLIKANFESADIIEAYSIEIVEGATLTLRAGGILKLLQPISKDTKSKLKLMDDSGLLVKSIDARNPSEVLATFTRVHPNYVNQYTGIYMSSPVTGQTIGDTNPSIAYSQSKYNASGYVNIPVNEVMLPAIGYTETGNGDGNYTGIADALSGVEYPQTYNGVENTSNYTVSLNGAGGYNLIGNPYASYLDADSFLQDNDNTGGTIYLWTHNTLADTSGNGSGIFRFTSNDFAVYNVLGGVNAGRDISIAGPSGTNNYDIPDGKIAFGTGFFMLGSGSATFKTSMTTPIGSQIFRTKGHNEVSRTTTLIAPPTRHRIWLNLGIGSSYRQTLIGYATGATSAGNDRLFDSPIIDQSSSQPRIDFYSLASGSSTKLAIQGRDNFQNTDSFQLGYKVSFDGNYTISSIADGMFSTQAYYIFDANDGQYHTLPYSFDTVAGIFNSRLKVVFNLPAQQSIVWPVVCGTQIGSIDTVLFTQNIPGVSLYNFEVRTGGAYPGGTVLGTYSGNLTYPYQFNLNFSAINPNTTYWIRPASYKLNDAWVYGATCQITTPPAPTSQVISPTCGSTVTSRWARIDAQNISAFGTAATMYRFTAFTNGTTFFGTVDRTVPNCQLAQLGVTTANTNTTFTIRVDVEWRGVWQLGVFTCDITTANVLTRQIDNDLSIFEVSSYPNPFNDNFKLDVNTSSEEPIQFSIYDMLGRQIETRQVYTSDIDTQEFGQNYTSGVYNVIVKQGENTKTVRMIKR